MLANVSSPQYLLRMGSHAERFYLEWASTIYDAMILNANLVEGTPAACLSLVETLVDKPYIIDPISHAFALPVGYLQSTRVNKTTGKEITTTKRTFQRLAERYGEPFAGAVGTRPLTPDDFADTTTRENAVERILTYQRDRLEEEQPDSGPLRGSSVGVRPRLLIIPYFFIDQARTWVPTNLALVNDAVQLRLELPSYAMVLVNRTLLQDLDMLKTVAQEYCNTGADGFFVWVSDQVEQAMGRLEVSNFVQFVRMLCSDGRPIYNMYGGYLSALLSTFGLTGFCHGIGYGEHRNVVPVLGGGVPPAKYYFPPLHRAFVFADIQPVVANLSTEQYYSDVCNCPVCQNVIGDNFQANFQKYGETELKGTGKSGQLVYIQTSNSVRFCRGHYLVAGFIEIQQVRSTDIKSLISQLRSAEQTYQHSSGFPAIGYLRAWIDGISTNL